MKSFKKALSIILIVVVITALCACGQAKTTTPGSLITVDNAAGIATGTTAAAPSFGAVEGQDGWSVSLISDEGVGVDFYVFAYEANAEVFPIHTGGPDQWIAYVESGSGELLLGGSDGVQKSSVAFKKGDYILFRPDTFHGWKPGKEDTKILFIKVKAAS